MSSSLYRMCELPCVSVVRSRFQAREEMLMEWSVFRISAIGHLWGSGIQTIGGRAAYLPASCPARRGSSLSEACVLHIDLVVCNARVAVSLGVTGRRKPRIEHGSIM